jgi:uncharacterized damage-inducible protein DinB
MSNLLEDIRFEFQRHKELADKAMASLDDEAFFRRPGEAVNPIALIVKHLARNLRSRWSDFLTSDGEKPWRNRDEEFVLAPEETRDNLMHVWQFGWSTLFATIDLLKESDLDKTITIRGEPHSARQALLRGMTHATYHVGQILYLARWLRPDAKWLTIAPGQSQQHAAGYRKSGSR